MALIRLYMTMSLDGYVTGPQDSVDAAWASTGSASSIGSTGATTRDRAARCSPS
jgi:hypothetical protein